jgi:small ligand-binding sensory domain FIST
VKDAELVLLLADPFTFDIERCLGAFNRHAPGVRVVGGMASAGQRPGSNAIVLNDWIAHEGGVGLVLGGALRADVVVSQGCRPVGPPLEVTRAEGNIVLELDGQPALERAEQVLRALSDRERRYLEHGLYLGRPCARARAARVTT